MSVPFGINTALKASLAPLSAVPVIPARDTDFPALAPDQPVTDLNGYDLVTNPVSPSTADPGDLTGQSGGGLKSDGTTTNVVIAAPSVGKQERVVSIELAQVTDSVGGVAAFIQDWQNYLFAKYDPVTESVVLIDVLNGTETVLATWSNPLSPGAVLGILVTGQKLWLFTDNSFYGTTFSVPSTYTNNRPGFIINAPSPAPFINRYRWSGIPRGYGRKYGLGYAR